VETEGVLALPIIYKSDIKPDASVIAALYRKAQLNRPVDNLDRLQRMYEGSNLVISAWDGDKLVGVLRGWLDEAYDGYICDLAVDPDLQKSGIGKELLNKVTSANSEVQFVLRASKIATDYYKHIGWGKIENGWYFSRER